MVGEPDRDFESRVEKDTGNTARILPDDRGRQDRRVFTPYEPYEPQVAAMTDREHERDDTASIGDHTAQNASFASNWSASPASQQVQIRRGPSSCAIVSATLGLLVLACALLAFVTLREGMDGLGKLTGLMPSFNIMTTPTVTIDTSRPTVIDRVRALGRLETVEYHMEKVVSGKSSGPLPDFLTGDKILLVAYGEVTAGVDLSKLEPEDIAVVSDTVTIRLPEPELLHSTLDNSRTYVYDRETGLFSKPDPDLETQVRQAAEQQIEQAALEDGILGKARANAEEVLRTLITGLGYKEVKFEGER
jgi:hypothetical protein